MCLDYALLPKSCLHPLFDNLIHCLKCCCYDKDPIGNKHLCFYGLSLGVIQ